MNLRYLLFFFTLLILTSCIEEFDPVFSEIRNQNNPIVIEAILNPALENQEVYISTAKTINEKGNYVPVRNAVVELLDDNNECYVFTEGVGKYSLRTNAINFSADRKYSLYIKLANGEEYVSSDQRIPEKPTITDLSIQVESDTVETDALTEINTKVNIYEPFNESSSVEYFRYKYESVYAYQAPNQGSPICWDAVADSPPENIPAFRICYLKDANSLPLNIFSKNDSPILIEGAIKALSLEADLRFYYGNSMLITKENLTESFYEYLNDMKAQNSYGGDIFQPPPTQLIGNIRSVQNEDEIVLGYFSITNSISKRLFIDNPGLNLVNDGRCFYDPNGQPPSQFPSQLWCCDCLLYPQASAQQPEFWGESD